ncbi:type I toxin-antitoxin system Fst family toxin [Apilactobacillus timberlakei]|nr:type I toxin-antitoxin system Fst family toxin [Apilactobacillus timberlakei]TPR21493.1 type I toxin-antitoxin system Fst family toxin [Apilactobacillus timberlakei]
MLHTLFTSIIAPIIVGTIIALITKWINKK